jgi:heptosyltransferase-2
VLSHPLLVRLKELDPSGSIDVLAPSWALPVYRRMPEVAGAIAFAIGHGELKLGERRRFAKTLARYERAIVLPNSWKSALVAFHADIPVRTGYRGEMRFGIINDMRDLDEAAMPRIVDRYAALAEPRGMPLHEPVPEPRLRVDEAARRATAAKLGLDPAQPPVVFAPGAEYGPAKRWPARHFAELAGLVAARGFQVWLIGSSKDAGITAEVARLAKTPVVDLAGRTTLDEAIDVLSFAAHVVTNDSGLMHVAAALDRPTAAIFGSSSPEFTPPLSAHARVISLKLSCSPCFKRVCPLGHTNCLVTLEPGKVLQEMNPGSDTLFESRIGE